MKKNLLSVIAIALSLFAICFALLRAIFCEVPNDTNIGAMATLIGVFVTLHIGFQIYNGLELRKEVSKQTRVFRIEISKQKKKSDELDQRSEELKKLIADQKAEHDNLKNEMQESIDITNALIVQSQLNCPNIIMAFYFMHKALISSLKIKSPKYEYIFNSLKIYTSSISPAHFFSNI